MNEGTILVVEDEAPIRKLITFNLQRSHFEVIEAADGEQALKQINTPGICMVILDIMLPDIDGFEICSRIREDFPGLPVIIVSARGQDMEKIMGLELGADDYIVKPFNPLELVARIRAILRRAGYGLEKQQSKEIKTGPFVLEGKTQRVYRNGQLLKLTTREFRILKFLLGKLNEPVTRDELLNEIWGLNYFGDPKTVDVHIRRLREKVEKDPSNPDYLKTIWGYGYCFCEE